MTILVTGATGTIGSEILTLLTTERKAPVRALVHTAARMADVAARGAEPHLGAFEDPGSLGATMRDADTLILTTSANPHAAEQASNAVDVRDRRRLPRGRDGVPRCVGGENLGRPAAGVFADSSPAHLHKTAAWLEGEAVTISFSHFSIFDSPHGNSNNGDRSSLGGFIDGTTTPERIRRN